MHDSQIPTIESLFPLFLWFSVPVIGIRYSNRVIYSEKQFLVCAVDVASSLYSFAGCLLSFVCIESEVVASIQFYLMAPILSSS